MTNIIDCLDRSLFRSDIPIELRRIIFSQFMKPFNSGVLFVHIIGRKRRDRLILTIMKYVWNMDQLSIGILHELHTRVNCLANNTSLYSNTNNWNASNARDMDNWYVIKITNMITTIDGMYHGTRCSQPLVPRNEQQAGSRSPSFDDKSN